MNLAQIDRLAMAQADLLRQAGTLASSITSAERYAWANEGNRRVEKTLRNVMDDYFVRTLNSATGTTALKIMGVSYTPSTSLNLAASTRTFSLPPDFLALKSIRCVTSSYEDTIFRAEDYASEHFQALLHDDTEASRGDPLYYDIYGERTLVLGQPLDSALDIEIAYVQRTKRLVTYSTGTIAMTTATTAVTGSSTVWSTGTPFDSAYLDILYGTSGSATVPTPDPSLEYDDVYLARVASITTDTALVTQTSKNGTLASGTGYLLASIPVVPEEYHSAIADWVTFRILSKLGSEKARAFADTFSMALAEAKSTSSRRQIADIETVEEYNPQGVW